MSQEGVLRSRRIKINQQGTESGIRGRFIRGAKAALYRAPLLHHSLALLGSKQTRDWLSLKTDTGLALSQNCTCKQSTGSIKPSCPRDMEAPILR